MPEEPAGTPPGGETPPAGQTPPPGDGYAPPPNTPADFAEWLKSRPEAERTQYDTHTRSLQSGLERERDTNRTLRQEIKNIAAQAQGATKQELDALSEKLAVADQRIDFYRQAVREGVPNVDLAWLAAKEIGAFDKHGAPDFSTLKAQYPELFPARRKPAAQAGAGSDGGAPSSVDMNAFIRKSAGRP
jgi:hypothetical protein